MDHSPSQRGIAVVPSKVKINTSKQVIDPLVSPSPYARSPFKQTLNSAVESLHLQKSGEENTENSNAESNDKQNASADGDGANKNHEPVNPNAVMSKSIAKIDISLESDTL